MKSSSLAAIAVTSRLILDGSAYEINLHPEFDSGVWFFASRSKRGWVKNTPPDFEL